VKNIAKNIERKVEEKYRNQLEEVKRIYEDENQ
jgi:hypothetical protein